MSRDPNPATIPARASVDQLASAIGRDRLEVQAVLAAIGEPDGPDDLVGSDVAIRVGRTLGVELQVEARDLALEILYQLELGGGEPDPATTGGKVGYLVQGVLDHKEALDHEIESASEHWSVARMPVVDRTILRIGLFELRHSRETPTAVVVAEAVRLAKTYSTERSGAFVNGVLAALARTARG